jgi:hypothetical protein
MSHMTEVTVAYYNLRFKDNGAIVESKSFQAEDGARAFLLAQNRHESAELWKDGTYITTITISGSGAMQLVQEQSLVIQPGAEAQSLAGQPNAIILGAD